MKIKYLILSLACLYSKGIIAQSITIDPSTSSTINTSRATNYIDINKTGTNNFSGLRFLQNSVLQGGLFFNEDYNYFNLGNSAGTPGLVWERSSQMVGIGNFDPSGKLHITANSTGTIPTLLLEENNNADGARINFENFSVNKRWTLYALNTNSAVPSGNVFNIYHSETGNIAQFYGDGNTKLNGFTQLGSNAPKIKTKKITGTTANASTDEVSTEILYDKVLDYSVLIEVAVQDGLALFNYKFKPASNNLSGHDYRAFLRRYPLSPPSSSDIAYVHFDSVPSNLRNRPYSIYITYEE